MVNWQWPTWMREICIELFNSRYFISKFFNTDHWMLSKLKLTICYCYIVVVYIGLYCCHCQLAGYSYCCLMHKQLRRAWYAAARLTSWTTSCWQCHDQLEMKTIITTRQQWLKMMLAQDQFSCPIFHKERRKTLCSCSLKAGEDAREDQSSLWNTTHHVRRLRWPLRTARVSCAFLFAVQSA